MFFPALQQVTVDHEKCVQDLGVGERAVIEVGDRPKQECGDSSTIPTTCGVSELMAHLAGAPGLAAH